MGESFCSFKLPYIIDTETGLFSHNFLIFFFDGGAHWRLGGTVNAVYQRATAIQKSQGIFRRVKSKKTIALWAISYYLFPSLILHGSIEIIAHEQTKNAKNLFGTFRGQRQVIWPK